MIHNFSLQILNQHEEIDQLFNLLQTVEVTEPTSKYTSSQPCGTFFSVYEQKHQSNWPIHRL